MPKRRVEPNADKHGANCTIVRRSRESLMLRYLLWPSPSTREIVGAWLNNIARASNYRCVCESLVRVGYVNRRMCSYVWAYYLHLHASILIRIAKQRKGSSRFSLTWICVPLRQRNVVWNIISTHAKNFVVSLNWRAFVNIRLTNKAKSWHRDIYREERGAKKYKGRGPEFPHSFCIKRRLNIYPEGAGHLSTRLVALYFAAVYLFNINASRERARARSHPNSLPPRRRRRRHFGKQRHTCYSLLEVWSVAKHELLALSLARIYVQLWAHSWRSRQSRGSATNFE